MSSCHRVCMEWKQWKLAFLQPCHFSGSRKPARVPKAQKANYAFPPPTMHARSYRNLTQFNATGPLTKALLTFLLSEEGQDLAAASGLGPLPQTMLETAKVGSGSVTR